MDSIVNRLKLKTKIKQNISTIDETIMTKHDAINPKLLQILKTPISHRLNYDRNTQVHVKKYYKTHETISTSSNTFIRVYHNSSVFFQTLISYVFLTQFFNSQLYKVKVRHLIASQKYFRLHLWLIQNGIYHTLLITVFILIPSVLNHDSDSYGNIEPDFHQVAVDFEKSNTVQEFVNFQHPNKSDEFYDNSPESIIKSCYNKSHGWSPDSKIESTWFDYTVDILTGSGVMVDTLFFFGYYGNFKTVGGFDFTGVYVCVFFALSLMTFFDIAMRAGRRVYKKFNRKSNAFKNHCVVFTGWHFGLKSESRQKSEFENLAQILEKTVYVKADAEKLEDSWGTTLTRVSTSILFIFVWFLSLTFISVGTTLSFSLLSEKVNDEESGDEDGREQKLSAFVRLVYEYLPSMIIFAVNFFSAQIWYFFQDKNFERFQVLNRANVLLRRLYIIKFSSVFFYFMTLYSEFDSCHARGLTNYVKRQNSHEF